MTDIIAMIRRAAGAEAGPPNGLQRRRAGSGAATPAPSRSPPAATPAPALTNAQRFPFPMANDPAPSNPQANAPVGSLSSLSPQEYEARRARAGEDGAAAGRLASDAGTRQQIRPHVERGAEDVPAFPFPVGENDANAQRGAAIDMAARNTGAPAGYLRALAGQEGGNRDDARNPRSTATGITQFTEATWLDMMAEHGARYGLPENLRNAIQRRPNGSLYVENVEARRQIMALRGDAEWSMLMGGHLFNREAATIRRAVGPNTTVTVADIYMGHFLGGSLGGHVLSQIAHGHGNVEARAAVRRFYSRNPSQAQQIIDSNPRQFAAGVTLAQLHRMQVGDLIAHGERNGVPRAELQALVTEPVVSDMTKGNGSKQLMSAQEITQQANQRDWQVRQPSERDPAQPATDPLTREPVLPTAEEQRLQREQQRQSDEEAIRNRRRSITLRGRGLRVTQPF